MTTTAANKSNGRTDSLPRGWKFRETPGHGYLRPAYEDNQRVPAFIRENEYEEDCAYHIPIVFNPHLFTEEAVTESIEGMKRWFPAEYERAFNVKLERGESYLKDNYFYIPNDNIGKYTPNCAWGRHEGLPEGMVLVCAGRVSKSTDYNLRQYRDDEKYFLIPSDEYKGSGMYFAEDAYPQTDLR